MNFEPDGLSSDTSSLSYCPIQHVAIIGAGISGLISAYELIKSGHAVSLIEADPDHIGGRIRTLRSADGSYAEMGAMRIPKNHDLTLKYVELLDLELRPFIESCSVARNCLKGQCFSQTPEGFEELKKRFQLTDSEMQMTPDQLWKKVINWACIKMTQEEINSLYTDDLNNKTVEAIDQLSLGIAMRNAGLSQGAIELLAYLLHFEDHLNTAFSEHLREELSGDWSCGFYELVGGMDQITSALFKKIQGKLNLHQGCKVKRVAKNDRNYSIEMENTLGHLLRIDADWVICTVSLGALTRIDLNTVMSDQKARASKNIHFDTSTKVLVKCSRRFWELNDQIYGGHSNSDTLLGRIWYPSDNAERKEKSVSNAPSYLLASYTSGARARHVDSLSLEDLKRMVVESLMTIHPSLNCSEIISIHRWSWSNVSETSGGFTLFMPGEHRDHYSHLIRPEEQFLLAGEHVSLSHSWIQGSIKSALTCVDHIRKSLQMKHWHVSIKQSA